MGNPFLLAITLYMALDPTNFTDLVEQFVRGSIRRPTDTLGVRRNDISFTDIQEAAAGTFLLYPQAPFYVLYLACQRVQELILAEEQVILELLDLVLATGRTVNPIKDLSPLSNITSALLELESAIGQRSQSFPDIEQVSAFKRFDDNVNRFLDAYGRNVKDGGTLVETPQGARTLIPELVDILKESHDEIVRRVTLIRQGLTNYEAVNLPAISAAGVISRSRGVIQGRTSSLSSADEDGRLAQNLDTVKELLAARALVRRYGSLSRPNSVYSGNITAVPYSDEDNPASMAELVGDKFQHILVDGKNQLDFYLDRTVSAKFSGSVTQIFRNGIYEMRVLLTGGNFPALGVVPGDVVIFRTGPNQYTRWVVNSVDVEELECSGDVEVVPAGVTSIEIWPAPDESVRVINNPPFEIRGLSVVENVVFSRAHVASESPDNYAVRFNFDGTYEVYANLISNTQVTVGWSGDLHVGQLCESFNTQWQVSLGSTPPGRWEPYFPVPTYQGEMVLTDLGSNVYRATVASGSFAGVLSTGFYVKFMTGPNKHKFFKVIATDGATRVDFDSVTGGIDITNSQVLQIGKNPRVKVSARDQYMGHGNRSVLSIEDAAPVDGAPSLGLLASSFTGTPLKARVISEAVNAAGIKVGSRVEFVPSVTCSARTNPLAPTTLTLYKSRGVASVVASGLTCLVTLPSDAHASVQVGDYIVFRTSNPINVQHLVTVKGASTILTAGGTGIASQSSVEFEIGDAGIPDGNALYTVVIPSGPNAGNYDVLGRINILDLVVSPQIPQRQDLGKDPVFMEGVQLGFDYPVFFSRTEETSSSILVNGSAAQEFFNSVPTTRALGTTKYLQLSAVPTGLQAGDVLEYYATSYNTVTESRVLQSVDFTTRLIEVDPPTPSSRTYTISQNATVPFALLKVAQLLSTNGLEEKLQVWLDRAENGAAYFTDLNRFINPLLANENPTAAQVNDALIRVKDLYQYLTIAGAEMVEEDSAVTLESILDGYSIATLPQIETLLSSFKEKGADRAVDILLEADFVGFFGVDVDTSSYAGAMLKQLRDLAREDLPMRKIDRKEGQSSQVISTSEDEDFEFSGSDVEGSGKVPTG